jgi:hypothetical protein
VQLLPSQAAIEVYAQFGINIDDAYSYSRCPCALLRNECYEYSAAHNLADFMVTIGVLDPKIIQFNSACDGGLPMCAGELFNFIQVVVFGISFFPNKFGFSAIHMKLLKYYSFSFLSIEPTY